MADSFDVDQTLEEYGYPQKTRIAGYIALSIFLLIAIAAALYLAKLWNDEKSRYLQTQQSFDKLTTEFNEVEIRNATLSGKVADLESEMELLKQEWTSEIADLEAEHKETLQRTYDHMNEIVYDSKKTLSYINDIEGRLRKGQKMNRMEAAKLANIVNGLSFLHEQYKKPIKEFHELDRYFQRQLDAIPASGRSSAISSRVIQATPAVEPDPADTTNLIGKIFQNRKYKAKREAYLEEKGRAEGIARGVVQGRATGVKEGKREALTQARQVVQQAYSRAQKQMNQLQLDKDNYLKQLDQVVEWNNLSVADVEDFFQNSKQILKIHDEIMSVEPTKLKNVRP